MPGALMVAALLLATTVAIGCTSDDTADTLDQACTNVDMAPIEQAADRFVAAQTATEAATTESEVNDAVVDLLNAGSTLFTILGTSLEDLFDNLAEVTEDLAVAAVPRTFTSAAGDFTDIANDISEAGTITDADIERIDEVGGRFDELDSLLDEESAAGVELRDVPECEELLVELDEVFARL